MNSLQLGTINVATTPLDAFPNLTELEFSAQSRNFALSDADFAKLAGLKRLQTLAIRSLPPEVGDGLFAHLAGMSELRELTVENADGIVGTGLSHVPKGKLKKLVLDRTSTADAALREMAGAPLLEELSVTSSHVGNAGLAALAGAAHLRTLNLYGTAVDDAGMEALAKLPELSHIELAATNVSDTGLGKLHVLTKLSHVNGAGSAMTKVGGDAMNTAKAGVMFGTLFDGDPRGTRPLLAIRTDFTDASEAAGALSPDGRRIAIARGAKVEIRDLADPKKTVTVGTDETRGQFCEFSPDGRFLALGWPRWQVWNVETGELAHESDSPENEWRYPTWFPSGQSLALVEETEIAIVDLPTRKERTRWKFSDEKYGTAQLAVSPDGKRIAACRNFKSVALYDTADGRTIREWKRDGSPYRVQFLDDGRTLWIGGHPKMLLADVADGTVRSEFDVAVSSGSTFCTRTGLVATVDSDRPVVYDGRTGKQLVKLFGSPDGTKVLGLSADGSRLLTSGRDGGYMKNHIVTFKVWDLSPWLPLKTAAATGGE